jgi:hypothetical protein
MIGLVVFSFALRHQEPSPCNIRLAKSVERIAATEQLTIAAQWEVARALRADGFTVTISVEPPADGSYLGSEEVWEEAKALFDTLGITEVIPVANPFLHLWKVRKLIEDDGFTVINKRVGWIGFDSSPQNIQWWCRGPLRLTLYAIRQKLSSARGGNHE